MTDILISEELRAAAWRLTEARERELFFYGTPLGRRIVQEHTTALMALVDRVHDLEDGLRPLTRRETGVADATVTQPWEAGSLAAERLLSHGMTCSVVSLAELWAADTFRDGGAEADEAISAQISALADWAADVEFLEGAVRVPAVARMEAHAARRWAGVSRFAARLARRFGGRAAA